MTNKNNVTKIFDFMKRKKASPHDGLKFYKDGFNLYIQDKNKEALNCFVQAEKCGYKAADMYCYMAHIAINEKNNFKLSLKYIDKALEIDNEYGFAYFLKGVSYILLEENEKCIENFLLAIKYDFNDEKMYIHLIEHYTEKEDYLKAQAYAAKAIKLYPEDYMVYIAKGNIFYNENKYQEALENYKKAEKYKPQENNEDDSNLYISMSFCYGILNNVEKALEYVNKSIFVNKNDSSTLLSKAFILISIHKYKEALNLLKIIQKTFEYTPEISILFAEVYDGLNKYKLALKHINKYIEEKQDDEGYMIKGFILIDLKEYELFEKHIEEMKKLKMSKHIINLLLVLFKYTQKEYEITINYVKKLKHFIIENNMQEYEVINSYSHYKIKKYDQSLNILYDYMNNYEKYELEKDFYKKFESLVNALSKKFPNNPKIKTIKDKLKAHPINVY